MQFLASIKRTIKLLAAHDIYTLVDFHQDAYGAPWGFGHPSWAVIAGGTNTPCYAWPINTFGGNTFQLPTKGALTIGTDLNFAFDAFWNDAPVSSVLVNTITKKVFTLLETYGLMLQFVSNYLSDQQGNILGYDPINEPEPGSLWTEGYQAGGAVFNFPNGFKTFDQKLASFYQYTAIPSLQAGHPNAIIWCEPNIYFDYNAPTFLEGMGPNVGFNFHNYDSPDFITPVQNAQTYQKTYNAPLLCSEYGGTTVYDDIFKVAQINDQYMLSTIFWAYFNNAQFNFFPNPLNEGAPTDPRQMGIVQLMSEELVPPNLNLTMLSDLTTIYPRTISGTPISFSTGNPVPNQFLFSYSTKLPNGSIGTSDTVIVVSPRLFRITQVNVTNGTLASQSKGIVQITADQSPTPLTVEVTITFRFRKSSIAVKSNKK
jgi:endoglycosylceramidase